MNFTAKEKVLGLLTGVAVLYSLYVANKAEKLAAKVDMAVDDLSEKTDVQISEEIIHIAVDRAVKREAGKEVKAAVKDTVREIKDDMSAQVKAAVKEAYSDIHEGTVREIERQIGELNVDKARNEAINLAKDKAAKKFDRDLETVLDKYDSQLGNVARIYSSISEHISGNDIFGIRR